MMNILIVSHPKPDWMIDYFYQGAVALGHNVSFFPERKFYSREVGALKEESHKLLQPEKRPEKISFFAVWMNLRRGDYDLIILSHKGYKKRNLVFSNMSIFIKSLAKKELSWRYMKLFPSNISVVVIDGGDNTVINKELLDYEKVRLYYKREIQKGLSVGKREKIMPMRFGINVGRYSEIVGDDDVDESYDICFIMNTFNHSLRREVKNRLESLMGKYSIFIHDSGVDGKIELKEYVSIVKSSRLTLSVSGIGWDCLRHYEIPAIGSVLFVNEPTINIGDFFEDGKECIMFLNDLSDFDSKIEYYLSGDHQYELNEIRSCGIRALNDRFDVAPVAEYLINSSS